MLKYDNYLLTFTEVPDEITLCFNLTQCPCKCKECFEPWLQDDRGSILDIDVIQTLVSTKYSHITCICFMGGDNDHLALFALAKQLQRYYPNIKLAMYSGLVSMDHTLQSVLSYYKIGPFDSTYGPLNKNTTNQRFYKKDIYNNWIDITYKFQNKRIE